MALAKKNKTIRLVIGTDHRGFSLKNFLLEYLVKKGYRVKDIGTFSKDSCDYPLYCFRLGRSIQYKEAERGIFICKTGIGSCIVLNKLKGIRAALVYNFKGAKFSRLHNDSNVLVMGSDFVNKDLAKRLVSIWLKTKFEGGRHLRRLLQIKKVEEGYEL